MIFLYVTRSRLVIQSSLIPIGEEGYQLGYGDWTLNMYTLAAWLSAAVSFLGLFLFLPCVFQEFDIAVKEAEYLVSMNECRTRHKGTSRKLSIADIENESALFKVVLYGLVERFSIPARFDLQGFQSSLK